MAKLIANPSEINAAGNPPKKIQEFVGKLNTQTDGVSIALMQSPSGWSEQGQTPEFDEFSLVLKGMLKVETKTGTLKVFAGQCASVGRGEWVKYSTPGPEGAEYVSVCVPAFSPQTVHRDKTN